MMKKLALFGLSFLIISNFSLAREIRVEAKATYFSSENPTFRDVYGDAAKFGLEAGLEVAKDFSVWAGLDYVHRTGLLTITQEETRVTIVPLVAGVRYEVPVGAKFRFHMGAGVQEVFFTEDNPLGTVNANAFGFIAAGGGLYRVTKTVGIDLFLSWSTCKMTNEGLKFKVGGLDAGVGIEIRF